MNLSFELPKLKLYQQLMGFFALIVLIPLLVLTISIYGINQKAVKKQIETYTTHTAMATYRELRLEMAWEHEQARLASEYWLSILALPEYAGREDKVDHFFKNYPTFEGVSVYDKSGKEVFRRLSSESRYRSPELSLTTPKATDVTYGLTYHPAFRRDEDRMYTLHVQVPAHVVDAPSRIGTIVFYKRFPYMGKLASRNFKSFHDGFVVADRDATIIAGPHHLIGRRISGSTLTQYQSVKEGKVNSFSSREPTYGLTKETSEEEDDKKLQKVIIKTPDLGWGLILEAPYKTQRHYILKARHHSVGLVVLCILLVLILGSIYSRGIRRNFRQLIKGIQALAEGNYSRQIRLITRSWTPFEVVYLATEFNRMAAKISKAWANIQRLNRELVYKNQQDVFVAQATQRLHSSLELSNVCDTAVQVLSERSDVLFAKLYMYQASQGQFTAFGEDAPMSLFSAEQEQVNQWLPVLEEQLVILLRGDYDLLDSVFPDQLPGFPQQSQLVIKSIAYQSQFLGALVLVRAKRPNYGEGSTYDDTPVIDLIASQIGVAIHQARQWGQLQKANQQLAELDEMKSNLIDTVSHELRTPLTSIKGYTSRLIRNESILDSDARIKSLKVVKKQADRLNRLVDDLLVIPDLEREGALRVFPDKVNLNSLIQHCVSIVQGRSRRHISICQPKTAVHIVADPDRMEQVLINLLENAVKYALEDADIDVTIALQGEDTVRIEVFNPCEPIPDDQLHTLFEKFKRLDERLTRTTRGTGLGLFIAKSLVTSMSGTIRLEGDGGFRVIIEMPLYQGDEALEGISGELSQTLV